MSWIPTVLDGHFTFYAWISLLSKEMITVYLASQIDYYCLSFWMPFFLVLCVILVNWMFICCLIDFMYLWFDFDRDYHCGLIGYHATKRLHKPSQVSSESRQKHGTYHPIPLSKMSSAVTGAKVFCTGKHDTFLPK